MIYREMREDDVQAVSRLIHETFHRYIAHTYTSEGVDNFSSPSAVGFYKKMGFRRTDPEQYTRGMLVNPMVLNLL